MLERLERGVDDDGARCVVLGLASRAAAPGADPHRHQAPARAQPAAPAYRACARAPRRRLGERARRSTWIPQPGGVVAIGAAAPGARRRAFAFDNESPRHQVLLQPYALASRLVTCGEYLAFMRDGGYGGPSSGSPTAGPRSRAEGWRPPLYWAASETAVHARRRARRSIRAEPVATSATTRPTRSRAGPARACRPRPNGRRAAAVRTGGRRQLRSRAGVAPARRRRRGGACRLRQLFGDVWEWTASAYSPYPGFRAGGRARSANTTASSCAISSSCAAARASRRARTSARATETSFRAGRAGSSAGIRLARDA